MVDQKTGVWIDWHGGECPVPNGMDFLFKLRSTKSVMTHRSNQSYELQWGHGVYTNMMPANDDIVAYLIIPTYVPPAKPKRWTITKMTKAFAGTCVLGAYQYGTVHVVVDRKTGKTKEIPIAIDGDLVVAKTMVELLNEVAP